MLTVPNIPLSDDKQQFLAQVRLETDNLQDFRAICSAIAMNGGARDIFRNEDGVPTLYLRRHYIYRGPEREAMIHQFFLGDKGPLHDHPAASWGQILSVGYLERLCKGINNDGITFGEYEMDRKAGDWSYRPASNRKHNDPDSFHKVKLRDASEGGSIFTFFVMEKRNNYSWGFRNNDGRYVPFDEMNRSEQVDKVQSNPNQYSYGWFPRRIG